MAKFGQLLDDTEDLRLYAESEKAMQQWEPVSRQIVEGRKADTREGRRLALDLSLGGAAEIRGHA